jgi:NADPH:quinone reductase-like Zn-dependent oxidoreductase
MEQVSALGADEAIDYTTTHFTKAVDEVDMVFDPQAGTQAERSLAVLKSGGQVICLLPPSETAVKIAAESGKHVEQNTVARNMADLAALAAIFEAGTLDILVAETFPLSQAPAAHRALAKGPVGKMVLVP